MTDDLPDFRSFDLIQVLLNREYPTTEVVFFLNERAAFDLHVAERRLEEISGREDDAAVEESATLTKKIAGLRSTLRESQFTYHLKGISSKIRGELLDAAFAKYPKEIDKNDIFGSVKENEERDEFFGVLLLQAMTEKIVAPDGSIMQNLTVEQVKQIRDHAPDAAIETISKAQRELSEGTKSGFESAVQGPDFSSAP